MDGRERCLWVEVDSKNTMAGQGKVLGKMRGTGGLAAAALEIDNGYDLEMFAAFTVTHIMRSGAGIVLQEAAHLFHLLGRIRSAA